MSYSTGNIWITNDRAVKIAAIDGGREAIADFSVDYLQEDRILVSCLSWSRCY